MSGSTITIHGRLEDHDPARDEHQHAQAEQVERSEHRARGCFASSASDSAVSVRLRARIYAAISTSSAVLIDGSGAGLPSPLDYLDASNASITTCRLTASDSSCPEPQRAIRARRQSTWSLSSTGLRVEAACEWKVTRPEARTAQGNGILDSAAS